jgi:tetratricopeptide (TPR) repeat protein
MFGDAEAPPAPHPAALPAAMPEATAQGQSMLAAAETGSAEERLLESEGRWEELIGTLIEGAATTDSPAERLRCYTRAASVYEAQLGDPEKAYITLQAAFGEDYGNEELGRELERLALALGRPGELISEYETALSEAPDNDQKVALLIQLARWQERADGGELAGAESKLRRALALEPGAMPAIRAMSDLLTRRNGGDWKALAEHLAASGGAVRRHGERAELLLAAAELYHRKLVDLPQAGVLYGRVLELDPESVPALEGLVEITWEQENWVRVLPLLEQLAGSQERASRAPADRSKTHQRAALAALRTGDDERARSHAAKVPDLDPDSSSTFVRDWLDIAFSRRWWHDVRSLGRWLQDKVEQGTASLTGAERAELRARLGQAHLEAGELEPARAELEQAVALDASHRHAREMLADVLGQLGDAAGALEHKKVLVDRASSNDQRFKMLVDMARASRDQLSNPQEALATFEEARSLKSSERGILHEMLELYTELKQWLPASEVLLSLAEDSVPPERARYLVAAGNILHYEMSDPDAALELYERALDDDPSDAKSFERVERILIAKQDHREQARAYRRMIKRVGAATDDQKRATLLHLWRGLGELFRTHLADLPSAVAALEVATQLDPASLPEQEALAELYEASGPDSYRAAVEKRTLLFEKTDDTETMVRQLKSLRAIYAQAGLWDRVFCVCAALTVLQAADPEELGFYERGAAAALTMPRSALTEEIWQKVIYDPGEERRLSLLYSCVAPVVALARAQDPKALGIKDRFRLEGDSDPSGVARMFEAGAGVLNVAQPGVYLNREFPGDLQIVNLRDATSGTSQPAVMVGPNIVANRVEKDVAFIVGRTLSLLRPDHLVLAPAVVPTHEELVAIVHAAFKLCQPSAPVPNPGLYQPYLTLFQKMLPPQALEPLASLVPWLIENWRELDVGAWRAAAERTADRAGLLLSGDLGAAVRVMHATRGMAASPSVLELVRWSISEGHLGVRELLGMAISAPG